MTPEALQAITEKFDRLQRALANCDETAYDNGLIKEFESPVHVSAAECRLLLAGLRALAVRGMPLADVPVPPATRDDLGLSVDMLDVDRLHGWANKIEEYGPDISHWSDRAFVVEWLRGFAGRLDAAVGDIGKLRAALAAPVPALPAEYDDTRVPMQPRTVPVYRPVVSSVVPAKPRPFKDSAPAVPALREQEIRDAIAIAETIHTSSGSYLSRTHAGQILNLLKKP